MRSNRRIMVSIIYILLGIGLTVAGIITEMDEFWSGMGSALIVVGIIQLVRFVRYAKDSEYRERMDTELGDERGRGQGICSCLRVPWHPSFFV